MRCLQEVLLENFLYYSAYEILAMFMKCKVEHNIKCNKMCNIRHNNPLNNYNNLLNTYLKTLNWIFLN